MLSMGKIGRFKQQEENYVERQGKDDHQGTGICSHSFYSVQQLIYPIAFNVIVND